MARNKIDKAALRESILNADGLSNEDKSQLLALLSEKKTYGLVWENHSEDAEELLKENIPVLKEVSPLRLPQGGESAPNHILIEGDNLHALTALTYTHEGKVDVIYIDPPYNTGNKDFVYNDSFVDSEDSYRHSKWLSFMEKRLKIAKKLLSDNGTIFISIDENELYQLKLLCDLVFGEKNFLGQWNWFKSATPPALSLKVKRNVEYILAYENHRSQIKYHGIQKYSSSNDPMTKSQNTIKELVFPVGSLNVKMSDGIVRAGIYGTKKYPNELMCDMIVSNGKNANEVTFKNRFIWKQSTLDEEIFKETKFDVSKQLVISYKRKEYDPEVPPNLINDTVEVGTTEEAGKRLSEIMGAAIFDYPKPVELIKYLLGFRTCSVVLDFFAGSGTTLQAVMQRNEETKSNCQCILIQGYEKKEVKEKDPDTDEEKSIYVDFNLCEEVTYERNRRVMKGFVPIAGNGNELEYVAGLKNNNLRYYKTEFVPRDNSHQSRKEQAYAMTDLLCIKEGIYEEKFAFGSLSLDGKAAMLRYFAEGDRQMLLVYDSRVIPYIVSEIKSAEKPENDIKIYIFADGSYPYTADFDDVLDRVQLVAMPYAMNRALKYVMPEAEDIELEVEPENEEQDA